MPYYVHDKTIADFANRMDNGDLYRSDYSAFATKVDARENCPTGKTVTFVMSSDNWRQVQNLWEQRLAAGEVYRCPWSSYGDGQQDNWYSHLRFDAPGKVHFFASSEHLYLDRITQITPGRYIDRYLRDQLSPESIKEYIAEITADNCVLKFATTEQEIHQLYNTSKTGFSSCMQRKRSCAEYDWQKYLDSGEISLHPAHVYAAPDLAVAYRGELNEPKQRAVVWPEKKTYQRIYGDGPLAALLHRAGYARRGIIGARVLRKEHPIDGFVMPYVDGVGSCSLDEDPRYIVLDNEGDMDCQQTSGSTADCPPEVEDSECEHCGSMQPYDEMYGNLCGSCEDERWRCDFCRATCFADEDGGSTDDGESLCESCFSDYEADRREEERKREEEEAAEAEREREREREEAEAEQEEATNDANV